MAVKMEKKSMPAAGQIMRLLEKSPSIPIYKEKDINRNHSP